MTRADTSSRHLKSRLEEDASFKNAVDFDIYDVKQDPIITFSTKLQTIKPPAALLLFRKEDIWRALCSCWVDIYLWPQI